MPPTLHLPSITRRHFMALGTAGMAAVLAGCGADGADEGTFDGLVSVIGAGPAGMTAAHLLRQRGVEVEILEAAPTYGGRIKHTRDFTDFPISLGGEWLHVGPEVLGEIVNDEGVEITIGLQAYSSTDTYGFFEDGQLTVVETGTAAGDLKFVGSSWLDFFETYVVPGIDSAMTFETQIVGIDATGDRITLTDASGARRMTDRVVVTVPLKALQNRVIEFTPALSEDRLETIDEATVWSGIKVFLEFGDRFYPTALEFPDSDTDAGQRLYYDAGYGQQTSANILGLFAVGAPAEFYQTFEGDALRDHVLDELDQVFDGAASASYINHITQNWNDEPFIGAAYLADGESYTTSRDLARSIDDRIFFAGSAYTRFDDWSGVHTAARSAIDAVDELLG